MLTNKNKERNDMEREIWDIVRVVEEGRLSAIDAHKKLCALFSVSGSLDTERKRIWSELCKAENESAFNSEITAETDNVYNMIFKSKELQV